MDKAIPAVLRISPSFTRESYHEKHGAPHLWRVFLPNESGQVRFIEVMGKDVHYLRDWAEVRIITGSISINILST